MGHAQVLPFQAKLAVGVQKRQEACSEGRYPALRLDAYDVFYGNFQQGDVGHAPLGLSLQNVVQHGGVGILPGHASLLEFLLAQPKGPYIFVSCFLRGHALRLLT